MIGQMVSHFKITGKLGEGGMGVVYKARDTHLDRDVALKFFPSSSTPSDKEKQRFIREAKAAAALNHPNICTIHNVDEYEGRQFIVMEYIKGETLRAKMEAGNIVPETALDYARQIAEALAAAHRQNIIHRDIKPENIMVDNEGRIKVMDFGLAKFKHSGDITKTGDTVGTTAYMSPEQIKGQNVDQRTDIWSLGIVLYELFTGKKPFLSEYPQAVMYSILNEEPEPIRKVRPELPSELETVVHKAMEKSMEDRYQHVNELLEGLNDISYSMRGDSGQFQAVKSDYVLSRRLFSPVTYAAVSVLIIAAISFFLYLPNDNIAFEERDWIMIADFENQTNEDDFSQFLNIILEVGLSQSTYVNIYERNEMLDILKNELDDKGVKTLTLDAVNKAAEHRNVSVVLIPAIKQQDDAYYLTATIRNIASNASIELEEVKVPDKEAILTAMDIFSKNIRRALGEPSSNISDSFTPIVQATTSSLQALKLYAEGTKVRLTDQATGYDLIEQSVELDPKFALAHADLGMHYYIEGQRKKGEEHFRKALDEMDRLTLRERLWIRAVVTDWRGNREKAIENYKSYLTQFPDDYNAWWRLGYTYLITGQYENCVDAYSRVVEFNPGESSSFINVATCYKGMDEKEQAIEYYERGFDVNPEWKKGIYVNNEYGFLLVELDSLEKARETFEVMLTEKETKARGLRSLALLNTYTGNFPKAIDYFKEAVLLNKSGNNFLSEYRDRMYLARAYRAMGMNREFMQEISEIELLVDGMDLSPAWLAKAGQLYARNGMVDKAEQILVKMENNIGDIVATSGVNRNLGQDQAFYHLLKGEILLAREDYEDAAESLQIANNIINNPESLAHCYYKAGNLDEAIAFYREVIGEKNISNEDQLKWILAHYRLGNIYEELGNVEEAVASYEQLLAIWEKGDEDLLALKDAENRLDKLSNL